MIKINKESDGYDLVANLLASIFGFASSSLVGVLSKSIISTNCTDSSSAKRGFYRLGKLGFETVTFYAVSRKMREDIDSIVDVLNDVSEIAGEYKDRKLTDDEIVYDTMDNGE